MWAYPGADAPAAVEGAASTATLVVLIITAFWVLAVVARPYEPWKLALLGVAGGAYFVIFLVKPITAVLHLHPVSPGMGFVAVLTGIAGAVLVEIVWQINRMRSHRLENQNS